MVASPRAAGERREARHRGLVLLRGRPPPGRRGRSGDNSPRRIARRRKLDGPRRAAAERRRHQIGDPGMSNRFDVVTSHRRLIELEHFLRGAIDEFQPSLRVDDNDAFDHPGENRGHAFAVAGEVRQGRPIFAFRGRCSLRHHHLPGFGDGFRSAFARDRPIIPLSSRLVKIVIDKPDRNSEDWSRNPSWAPSIVQIPSSSIHLRR